MASAIENSPDSYERIFQFEDSGFSEHENKIKDVYLNDNDEENYWLNNTLKKKVENAVPNNSDTFNHKKPVYLLDDMTTKYFEKGPLDSFHTGLYYKGSINTSIWENGGSQVNFINKNIENHFRGYFKDGKTAFRITTRYQPRKDLNFMQALLADFFISHQINKNHRIVLGNSRTHTGEEGSKSDWALPFYTYSQLGRNIGNTRKFGARFIGEYDLIEYDLGAYSSDSYFREFFPGGEFTGWVNLKPLGKTNGQYGALKIGGGYSGGQNGTSYNVLGAYARYEYKKIRADFEFSDANGYNGNLGMSSNHARGFYTSLYYYLNPKVDLMARYDTFQPNIDASNGDIKEYTVGLNYYIKGQGLRLMLNYIFRQNSFDKDSHRILIGTQIML